VASPLLLKRSVGRAGVFATYAVSLGERRFAERLGQLERETELPPGSQPVSERGLREAVLGTIDCQQQRRRWERLRTGVTV